jgi:ubiquinone/menaquinone biosynthesis C-methylase UbiE
MTGLVDWNQIRRSALLASHRCDFHNPSYWNQQAESVNNNVAQMNELTQKQLKLLPLKSEDNVLDIGAGTGRMTLPIAKRVKHVTALEPSENMLILLKENAAKENALNISYNNKSFEDFKETNTVQHDYVVASFSLFMQDIEQALLKMNSLASKAVFLFMSASPWMDPEMQRALYGTESVWSDFIFVYNILHDNRILANVAICDYNFKQSYANIDDAVSKFTQNHRLTPQVQGKLRDYLDSTIVEENGKLYYNRKRKAATIWWTTNP